MYLYKSTDVFVQMHLYCVPLVRASKETQNKRWRCVYASPYFPPFREDIGSR